MNTLHRILALIQKEIRMIFSDPTSRKIVFIPVILQSLLFPLAATLEVKHIRIAVLNEDVGRASAEIVQRLEHSASFDTLLHLASEQQMREVLDNQEVLAVVRFPSDFSRSVLQGESAPLQLTLDGRRSNSSQIVAGYIQQVANDYLEETLEKAGRRVPSEVLVRHRYNPNLDYTWFILPSLVGIILNISALILTALSVAREREQGTYDQLLVSPLTPEMVMLGKGAAAFVIGLLQVTAVILVAILVYRVPFNGSVFMLYGSAIVYFGALVGVGLLISSVCSTQQQAFLGAFAFMMPAVMLSGYAAPVENMPDWLQQLTLINPIRHFMVISKAVFLKAATPQFVWEHTVPLLFIAGATLGLSLVIFRRQGR